jgi:protease-4
MENKLKFSQKHPLLFGFALILTAMVLIIGAMAVFNFFFFKAHRNSFFGTKVGVVHINGLIADSLRITNWIDELARDNAIKGVIVRINSPGGVVGPSQEIYAALQDLARKKKVVASMGSVAASGGYYIACAAHKIVANPGTLTASIGVKAKLTNMQGLMQKLGIAEQTVTSGKLKNAGTIFRPLTPEEKKYFQSLVNDMHDQFVQDVARGRHMDIEKVRALADGRAMTGRQAKEAGLVDELGGFNKSLEVLRLLTGIKGEISLVQGPPEKSSLLEKFLGKLTFKEQILGPRWVFTYE